MERYQGKDEKIKALAEMNISDTALGIVVQNGYDETKEMIMMGSYEVLRSYFDIWFERCPELEERAFLWMERFYPYKTHMDGWLKKRLIKDVEFRNLCMIVASDLKRAYKTMPFFLRSLFGAIFNEITIVDCREKSIDDLCANYFAEIDEFI